ncbi:MAG: flagellin FliC, partial [Planctomycetota bacterium]
NGTYGTSERSSLNEEFTQLQAEIKRIAEKTEFNGKSVLLGSMDQTKLQVGPNAADTITISVGGASMTASGLNIDGNSVGTVSAASSAITAIDGALSTIDTFRGKLGAVQSRLESTVNNLMNISENVAAARSRIMDADFAAETANLTRTQILQQAGVAMLSQANAIPQSALALLQ